MPYTLKDKKPVVEGKSKKIYQVSEDLFFMVFKPHLRSITSNREGTINGTDLERLTACLYFMDLVSRAGIKTHLKEFKIVEIDGQKGLLVEKVKTIPLEFICRYYAAGSIVRMYPSLVKEGQKFSKPLYKFDVKQDLSVNGVDDPTINENYIVGLNILTKYEFDTAKSMLVRIGEIINKELLSKNIKLIDMKMEFGFNDKHEIVLIDEISQDCIRANDMDSDTSLTKDVYRKMKTDVEVLQMYSEFNRRLAPQ